MWWQRIINKTIINMSKVPSYNECDTLTEGKREREREKTQDSVGSDQVAVTWSLYKS